MEEVEIELEYKCLLCTEEKLFLPGLNGKGGMGNGGGGGGGSWAAEGNQGGPSDCEGCSVP